MSTSSHRPEIQALRAIAVALVVVFHVWPAVLRGGFVGVDVFFVISGFLITTQLLREVDRSGRVSLAGFWARRARRLLPAALVTLLACAVATIVFVPRLYWEQFLTEIGASTAYVQNWQLAQDAVDYMARGDRASPVQHFWSLSVEEQFYLLWPLLILGAAWLAGRGRGKRVAIFARPRPGHRREPRVLARRDRAHPGRRLLRHAHARVGVRPRRAARVPRRREPAARGRARAVLSWAGIAAILAAAIVFGAATAFPGSAALCRSSAPSRSSRRRARAALGADAAPRAPPGPVPRRHLLLRLPVALAAARAAPFMLVVGGTAARRRRSRSRSRSAG